MKIETVVIIFVLQVTFFAGVTWAVTRAAISELRREQDRDRAEGLNQRNNIGEKGRQTELKLFYVAMMLCPEDKPHVRQEILNALVRRLT